MHSAVRFSYSAIVVLGISFRLAAQTASKPLRASEVLALEAGGALPANAVHDIRIRGLNFHPDAEFLTQVKKAGADEPVVAALIEAKVTEAGDTQPDRDLPRQLASAAVLIKGKHYDEAAAQLSEALKASFGGPETGFVMGELLRQKGDFEHAAAVFGQILRDDPNFPEAHTKASFILYKLGDVEDALNEAKAALAQNPEDAEAHKNAGLALDGAQRFDAA